MWIDTAGGGTSAVRHGGMFPPNVYHHKASPTMKTLHIASFRGLTAALFLTLASFFAGVSTAGAQALSNIDEPTGGLTLVGDNGGSAQSIVINFITGASAPSFDLTEVDFLFDSPDGSPSGLTIGLYGPGFDVNTATGDFIASLTLASGGPATAGVSSFSVSATLAADTNYYLKLTSDHTAGSAYILQQPATTTTTGLPGWAYGDNKAYFNGLPVASIGNVNTAIYATAIPEPATCIAFAGVAVLGLGLWRRAGRRAA